MVNILLRAGIFFSGLASIYQAFSISSKCVGSEEAAYFPITILVASLGGLGINVNAALMADSGIEGRNPSLFKLIPLFTITASVNYGLNYLSENCLVDHSPSSETDEVDLAGRDS